ncbi:MAG TPA: ABC transporter permease [Candidatus Limnocylindrales bacterium]
MSAISTIADLTLRSLLGRRRTILLVLLAALPVVVTLLARVGGDRGDVQEILDGLVVRIVLPLSALVLGTSALGAELEDGTAVYILAKPVPRWQVVVAKLLVAGALTAALTVGSTLLTALAAAGDGGDVAVAAGYGVAGGLAAFAYTALFMALSVVTSRALIVGLIYTLVWEGVLASILAGTRILSVREATLAVAGGFADLNGRTDGALEPVAGVVLLCLAIGLGFVAATNRLMAWEIRAAD